MIMPRKPKQMEEIQVVGRTATVPFETLRVYHWRFVDANNVVLLDVVLDDRGQLESEEDLGININGYDVEGRLLGSVCFLARFVE
jgi:hypothetical protein